MYLNSESDESAKQEAMSKMKFLLGGLQKISYEREFSILKDLKTHILLLHQTLYDSLKQLGISKAEATQQDVNIISTEIIKFINTESMEKKLGDYIK